MAPKIAYALTFYALTGINNGDHIIGNVNSEDIIINQMRHFNQAATNLMMCCITVSIEQIKIGSFQYECDTMQYTFHSLNMDLNSFVQFRNLLNLIQR